MLNLTHILESIHHLSALNIFFILLLGLILILFFYLLIIESKIIAKKLCLLLKEKHELHALRYQVKHDALTGLINRVEFEKSLHQFMITSTHKNQAHTLFYLDIDRFKVINRSAGNAAGDALLIKISKLLKNELHHKDIIARISNDEFAILLPETNTDVAYALAEKFIHIVRHFKFIWNNKSHHVGLSIGLVTFSNDISINQLINHAEIACDIAKLKSGNTIAIYTEPDSEAAKYHAEIKIISNMREVVEAEKLSLHAHLIKPIQPNTSLKPFYELLIRLIDHQGNLINPAQFITIAERFNLMTEIDEWVINKVLIELGETIAAMPNFRFSINLSANSINAPHFLDFLQTALKQTAIPTNRIGFELTETAIINYLEKASAFMQTLKNAGCFIALDDFGSGLSSFNYLKYFPVTYIKMDGSFVRMISHNSTDRAIVESINDLAHKLNAYTIAEHVETAEVLSLLCNIGVDYAQGHIISDTVSLQELLKQMH